MTEQIANSARTALNGGINSSVTSITVVSASNFPSSSPYRITVESEIMVVTGGAGTTTWTVSRGQEGTTAASHAGGVSVAQTLTVQGLKNILLDAASSGTYASRPSTGNLYFNTDGPIVNQYNGTDWRPLGPMFEFTDPNQYSWTTFSSPDVYTTGPFQQYMQISGGSNARPGAYKTIPAAPYTVTACFLHNNILKNTNNGTDMGIMGPSSINDVTFIRTWYGSVTGATRLFVTNSVNVIDIYITDSRMYWYRINDDGTNVNYLISIDGYHFWQLYSESNTASPHGTADRIWWGLDYFGGSGQPSATTLLSWKEE
jgi:hypothetical protein